MSIETRQYSPTEGADAGKIFEIAQMPAMKLERFALRIIHAVLKARPDLPKELIAGGASALKELGIGAILSIAPDDAELILAEMLTYVQFVDAANPNVKRKLFEADIESVSTLLAIRMQWFDLNLGFLMAAKAPTM